MRADVDMNLTCSATSNGPKYIGLWLDDDMFRLDIEIAGDRILRSVHEFIDSAAGQQPECMLAETQLRFCIYRGSIDFYQSSRGVVD